MGNQQVLVNYDSALVFVQDLGNQLLDKGSFQHPSLGSIRLWQIKKEPQKLLFSFVLSTSELDSSILQVHQVRCKMQHPNLLKYYACFKESRIGGVEKQQYFFEYYPKTLKQITICAPLKEENIWDFVEQIINVMEYLQQLNKFHGNLSTEAIFIDEFQKVKLLDNLGQKRQNEFSISEDIFSLGLIILEMMTQRTSQLNFNNALKQLMGQYSLQLLQLTSKLLQNDVEIKTDFIELKKIINNRFKIPITNKQAQFIKTEEGYSTISYVQILDKQEIEIIKQKQLFQQQNQQQMINKLKQSQTKQIQEVKIKLLSQQIVQPQKIQIKQNLIKKNSIKQVSLQLNRDEQQQLISFVEQRGNPVPNFHQQRYSLQIQNNTIKTQKKDKIQQQCSQQSDNILNKQIILNLLQRQGNINNQLQNQSQKLDLRSSISSSHSTQIFQSQTQRISTCPNSVNLKSNHTFSTIPIHPSKKINKK
ncbi:unnamed protein product [Paramecium sonneborni]|uniref:Protein kinase domain-containing protein n=1 Tax=Paramecium sonneborni TaxID=65129 RepID=A0A8S1L533_9CILI|nr:unnamed protein product [Paramecium sonneborni]